VGSYTFDFSFLQDYRGDIIHGIWLTFSMSVASMLFGLIVGTGIALIRLYGPSYAKRTAIIYIEAIRNTPLIVQVFWIFFGLAVLEVRIGAFTAAIIALVINVSAYSAEIIRAGLASIHKGQTEAALCLALSRRQMIFSVLLPQALERMYPALVSQFILLMLASSLMSQISVEELTGVGYMIQSFTFRGFEVYLVIAAVYLALSLALRGVCFSLAAFVFPKSRKLKNS
jgi:polar amino acid transport system permease protein